MKYRSNFVTNGLGDLDSMDIKGFLAILKYGLEIAFSFTGGEMEPFQKKKCSKFHDVTSDVT